MKYILTTLAVNVNGVRVAPFPTYSIVAEGPGNKALITIPDADFLGDDGQPIIPGATQKLSAWLAAAGVSAPRIAAIVAEYGDPDVTNAIDGANLARLRARLDKRYREHAGEYAATVG